jgi:hypothetical protein
MQLNQRSLLAAGGILVALIAIVGALVVFGGGDEAADPPPTSSSTSSTTTSTSTSTTLPSGPFLPLTGEGVDADSPLLDQAAIVVKISNNRSVQDNWQGIDQADVVIEERIEANATRFAAVFHSVLPESVGPIRSGRTSDLDLLANLGTPILVYSGANPSVTGQLRALQDDGLVALVVDRGTNVDLVRDNAFSRPDNLFSNLVEIEEKYRDGAGVATPLFEYRQADLGERSIGTLGEGVTVQGADSVSFVWDETRGYVRVQNGEVHSTLDGEAFVFDNIVVLEVRYTPSTFAPGSVDAETVGTGPLNLLIGGKRYEGTWSRASRTEAYQFFDAAGDPLRLDPGQTWMTLVPAGSYEFDVAPEIAALALEADG